MAYAWQLNEKLAIGVTGVLASQSFNVRGVGTMAPYTETYASSGGSVMPTHLSGNGTDWTYGGGAKVGLHWELTPAISVGVMYQTKIFMTRINDYSDLLPGGGELDMPADFKIGITWKALDNLAFSADAEHIFYGGVGTFSNPIQNLLNCPTANQGGTDVTSCFGGKNGASLGWEDITVYKMGVRWGINDDWSVRAGLALTDQPIKNPQTSNNLMTQYLAEAHYTLGLSVAVNDHAELNFSAYYSEEESQIWPNFFDPSQDVMIEEDQFDFEVSYSWKF
jgi:long-chain fatty acid transport protein